MGRTLKPVSSTSCIVEADHRVGVSVEPYDHFTLASLPRFHSLLALRRSRSYWAGVSVMEAAILVMLSLQTTMDSTPV